MSKINLESICANPFINGTTQADCYIFQTYKQNYIDLQEGVDNFFLLGLGAFAFFRQCGFAMFKAGMVQEKNVVNTIVKSILDAAIGGIVFWIFGYAFAFGGQEGNVKSFIGNTDFFARNDKQGYNQFSRFFFQLIFAQTAASIVSGALAERSKLSANFWASSFISAFVYPVIAHNAWSKSGFLSAYNDKPFRGVGVIDMGGSGVIHVTGGLIALIGAIIVGPRTGRFYDEQGKPLTTPRYIRNFCPSFLLLGVFVAWVGWIGFNPGVAGYISNPQVATGVGLSPVTTTLSAAAGALSGLLLDTAIEMRRTRHTSWDIVTSCNGCLAGLVAISGGSQVISTWAAVLIGGLAGCTYYAVDKLLLRFKIDDPVGAIPVHLGGGILGIIATGLFANPYYMNLAGFNSAHPGWFYSWGRSSGDANLLLSEFCLLLYIVTWVSVLMIPFYLVLKATKQLRIDPNVEDDGCDFHQHRILPKPVEQMPQYDDPENDVEPKDGPNEKQLVVDFGEDPGSEKPRI